MFYVYELAAFREAIISLRTSEPTEEMFQKLAQAASRLALARHHDVLSRAGLPGLRTVEAVASDVEVYVRCESGWAWN